MSNDNEMVVTLDMSLQGYSYYTVATQDEDFTVEVNLTTGTVKVYNEFSNAPVADGTLAAAVQAYPEKFAQYAATAAAYNSPEALAERAAVDAQIRATQAKLDATRAAKRAARG